MHVSMDNYLKALEVAGRAATAQTNRRILYRYADYLRAQGLENPLQATEERLRAFQRHLAEAYRRPDNRRALAKSTQATWISVVKSFYAWSYRRGMLTADPARRLKPPRIVRRKVKADPLDQQETMAFLQTQAQRVAARETGTRSWAVECRNLALLALAFATGRRRESLRDLRVGDLDFTRNEIRVEWEKGQAGRVLPVAAWAMQLVRPYLESARGILLGNAPDPGWIFLGARTERICGEYLGRLVQALQVQTVEAHPDLDELAAKKLSSHSTRVTFASVLFRNGADIRAINELLLHRRLSTTAQYTPLHVDDLRRACRLAHPRA
ncbi:MAG: tyrosine recombinase XerC [Planctomycetota bacterium]